MEAAFPWIALVLGLCLGSFYTVCVHRYLTGGSILWPGSHCPVCGHRLRPWENIPLFSFVIQRGRCRACAAPIPWRYPILEGLSGAAAMILALRFGLSPAFFVYLVATGIFLVAGAIDWETYLLPDIFTYPLGVLGLIHPLFVPVSWTDTVLGAALGAGLLWAVREGYARVRGVEGLGLGDVKLMVGLGALTGATQLPLTILCASLFALATFALCIARTSRSQGLATAIPFGPFLCAGAWLVLVAGEWFATWGLG
jgi:leader peptidase (prepilin peptidase)/N-methyltransferase